MMTSFRPRRFTEWLLLLWRRKYVLLFVAILTFAAALLVIGRLPNVYESRASIAVDTSEQERATATAKATEVAQTLTSRPMLETVAKTQNPYGTGSSDAAVASAAAKLSQAVTVDVKYREQVPESVEITFRHADPKVAQSVVAELAAEFERADRAISQQRADDRAALDAQVADLNQQLFEQSGRRAAASERGMDSARALSLQDAARARREAAASTVDELNDKQILLQGQIAAQTAEIADREKALAASSAQGVNRTAPAYGPLLAKKADLTAKLQTYATQYTAKHPTVIAAQTELAEVDRQIAALDASMSAAGVAQDSPAAAELRGLRRDLARMNAELDITKRERDRKQALAGGAQPSATPVAAPAPAVATTAVAAPATAEGAEADAAYVRLQERYQILLARQLAAPSAESAGGPAIFRILDPASLPIEPVGPNRARLALVGLVFALGVGLLVVAALELRRLPYIADARDVDYFLGVPVLAQIPEMVTNTRGGRGKQIDVSRRLVGMLAIVAATGPAVAELVRALTTRS